MVILASLPFALIGGVLAIFALGGMLSIGTLVGHVLRGHLDCQAFERFSEPVHLVECPCQVGDGDTSIITVEEIRSALEAEAGAEAEKPRVPLWRWIVSALLILALATLTVFLVVRGLAR